MELHAECGVVVAADQVSVVGGAPRLVAGHCARCDLTAFPSPAQCPGCLSMLEPRPLSGVGTLYSFSEIHAGPRGWPTPYVVGYVDVPEGARLFAHLSGVDGVALRPDETVVARAVPDGDGYRVTWARGEEVADA